MLITPDLPPLTAFRTWLEPQPWARVIGERVNCQSCPLAAWLSTVYQAPVQVDEELVIVECGPTGMERWPTPELYAQFIFRVDYAGVESKRVTVEECLTTLKALLAEEEGA